MCTRREMASVAHVVCLFVFQIPCVQITLYSFVFIYNLLDVTCLILHSLQQ